jgi:hypothetical protein
MTQRKSGAMELLTLQGPQAVEISRIIATRFSCRLSSIDALGLEVAR